MLQDEFKQFPSGLLKFGRSSEEKVIAIPMAIFELAPEEKSQALKELEEEMEQYRQKG
ncbi:hypothetical protein [Streptococcus anginosus]|uniref:hypothetical protein n=1 Tax=Streptococcus anginosus TaxID=1328 RepID=UPI00301005D5